MRAANLTLKFLLEVAALWALAYTGFHITAVPIARVIAAVGIPALGAILWGIFAAPKSANRLPDRARLAFELGFFAVASAGLAVTGQVIAGALLFAVFAVNSFVILRSS